MCLKVSQTVSGRGTLSKDNNQLNDGSGNDPINPRVYVLILLYHISFCNDAPKPKGKQTGEKEGHKGGRRILVFFHLSRKTHCALNCRT
jgi:hypothetical protein